MTVTEQTTLDVRRVAEILGIDLEELAAKFTDWTYDAGNQALQLLLLPERKEDALDALARAQTYLKVVRACERTLKTAREAGS